MAVEVGKSGSIIITGEHIEMARWITIRRGLRLEIKTGMKLSRGMNLLKIIQNAGITTARTKVKAYADLNAAMVEAGFDDLPLN